MPDSRRAVIMTISLCCNIHVHIPDIIPQIFLFKTGNDSIFLTMGNSIHLHISHQRLIAVWNDRKRCAKWIAYRDSCIPLFRLEKQLLIPDS